MLNRRHLLGALTLPAALSLGPIASAMDRKPYDQAAFDAAQGAGKPILVEVSAPWCPICKAQAPTLARLKSEPRFKELVSFNIDFDTQKDLVRRFSARMQSTLIAFKGTKEKGRSVGETNRSAIAALLNKVL